MIERRGLHKESIAFEVRSGSIAVTTSREPLMAVVGSNVAVCLWEKSGKAAGMANFSRPHTADRRNARARYGNVAVLGLLRMLTKECPDGMFEAHLFGGATLESVSTVGADNCAIARRILTAKGIEIVSEDTGGRKGRKILFDTHKGLVATLKVHELRSRDWDDSSVP